MGQPQRMFDSLGFVNQLKEAGVNEQQATVYAETLFTILDNQLLTEQDMHKIEMQLNNDTVRLSGEIQKLDFKLAEVETRLSGDIKLSEHKVVIKLGSLMAVLFSLLIGVMTILMKVMH